MWGGGKEGDWRRGEGGCGTCVCLKSRLGYSPLLCGCRWYEHMMGIYTLPMTRWHQLILLTNNIVNLLLPVYYYCKGFSLHKAPDKHQFIIIPPKMWRADVEGQRSWMWMRGQADCREQPLLPPIAIPLIAMGYQGSHPTPEAHQSSSSTDCTSLGPSY